jgi:hypothetical protein
MMYPHCTINVMSYLHNVHTDPVIILTKFYSFKLCTILAESAEFPLPYHLRLGLSSDFSPSNFSTEMLYAFLVSQTAKKQYYYVIIITIL